MIILNDIEIGRHLKTNIILSIFNMLIKFYPTLHLFCTYLVIILVLWHCQNLCLDLKDINIEYELKRHHFTKITKEKISITSVKEKSYNKISTHSELKKRLIEGQTLYQSINTQKVGKNVVSEHANDEKEAVFNSQLNHENFYESYTFDDPKSYKGFIIDAWPPSKDRNVTNYIANNFTQLPTKIRFQNKELMIVVQSRPSDIDLRMMWRYFMGKDVNDAISIIFIMGSELDLGPKEQLLISEEMSRYNDVAYIDGLIEHYHNLTLKSLYSLKLFLNDAWYPNPPIYMLKIDIDVFINIPKLFQDVIRNNELKNMTNFMLGSCNGCDLKYRNTRHSPTPFYDKLSEDYQQQLKRTTSSKFIIPSYMYNKNRYPSYLSGVAYLLDRTSAECILEKSKDLLLFTLEDVYITGFVAQECNIRRLSHPAFYSHPKEFDFDKDIIHNLDYSKCILYTNDLKQCSYDRLKGIERIMMAKK